MSKKHYRHQLYIELVKLQKEIIASDLKLVVILEGRDAAGKDGTIKMITKHLSPRETRVVALPKPSDREVREWYFQRYSEHLPAGGEWVIFNRSWYNRAGVEKVMGFCTKKEYQSFFTEVTLFERMLVDSGFIILKYYLDISKTEQRKRLEDRQANPLKQWKVSPIDQSAQKYWRQYSEARDAMLTETNVEHAPWFVVNAEDKDLAHLAIVSHLLSRIDYQDKDHHLLSKESGLVKFAEKDKLKELLYA